MTILCGLGNKGKKFLNTRHNIGFMVIDKFVEKKEGKWSKKYNGLFLSLDEEREIILFKPMTFVNLSGIAVNKLLQNLEISPSELVVVHDDLDISPWTIKFSWNKGDGGHKGIRSIIEEIGTSNFYRLRMGIGKPSGLDPVEYVLSKFPEEEKKNVENFIENGYMALLYILEYGEIKAMNFINSGKFDIKTGGKNEKIC